MFRQVIWAPLLGSLSTMYDEYSDPRLVAACLAAFASAACLAAHVRDGAALGSAAPAQQRAGGATARAFWRGRRHASAPAARAPLASPYP